MNFQPSKQYELLNKRKYMLPTEMKSMSELYKTKKFQVASQKLKSSVF